MFVADEADALHAIALSEREGFRDGVVGRASIRPYVHFGLVEVLVPFTGTWHPAAVAWGIIGLYALAAVEVTSLLRRRLSKRVWRATHFLSFPLFALTTVHSGGA